MLSVIDGLMRSFSPVGHRVMDFQAIIKALQQTGFQGFPSLEHDGHPGDPDMKDKHCGSGWLSPYQSVLLARA
jgi:sugar phosphate isomerase/epimerase